MGSRTRSARPANASAGAHHEARPVSHDVGDHASAQCRTGPDRGGRAPPYASVWVARPSTGRIVRTSACERFTSDRRVVGHAGHVSIIAPPTTKRADEPGRTTTPTTASPSRKEQRRVVPQDVRVDLDHGGRLLVGPGLLPADHHLGGAVVLALLRRPDAQVGRRRTAAAARGPSHRRLLAQGAARRRRDGSDDGADHRRLGGRRDHAELAHASSAARAATCVRPAGTGKERWPCPSPRPRSTSTRTTSWRPSTRRGCPRG